MADWDHFTEEFDSVAAWRKLPSTGTGGSMTQATFEGKECAWCKATAGGGYRMYDQDIGTIPNTFTIEMDVYVDVMYGAGTPNNVILITFCNGVNTVWIRWQPHLTENYVMIKNSSGSYVYSPVSSGYTGGNHPDGEWHRWRFEITNFSTLKMYRDNYLVREGLDCAGPLDTDNNYDDNGDIMFYMGADTKSTSVYFDNLWIDSSIGVVGNHPGLSADGIILGSRPIDDPPKMRYSDGTNEKGLCLVATTDANASPFRIYDGSSVKSIAKVVDL